MVSHIQTKGSCNIPKRLPATGPHLLRMREQALRALQPQRRAPAAAAAARRRQRFLRVPPRRQRQQLLLPAAAPAGAATAARIGAGALPSCRRPLLHARVLRVHMRRLRMQLREGVRAVVPRRPQAAARRQTGVSLQRMHQAQRVSPDNTMLCITVPAMPAHSPAQRFFRHAAIMLLTWPPWLTELALCS